MKLLLLVAVLFVTNLLANKPQLSLTLDDPNNYEAPLFPSLESDKKIRETLRKKKVKAALFVCGSRVDNPKGRDLLKRWDKEGHLIANHSYSHLDFNSESISYDQYKKDFERGEKIISSLDSFHKIFRFPFLKEGETKEKRDGFRALLKDLGYRSGHVTIDASDWYISSRMESKLRENPKLDLQPYRKFYLEHLLDRADFYRSLSLKIENREIKHTLLIHHNLLNALFLHDLIEMFQQKGWEVINAQEAFTDPIYQKQPNILPAGESLLWGLAKESGKCENLLRYPGESDEYEKPKMDKLGL